MAKDEDKDNALPSGYEHTEERLNETMSQVQQINERIENVPKDQGPVIEYRPPGFIGTRQLGTRDRTIAFLNEHRDQLKADTLAKTEADTRNADSKTGRVVRDRVREALYPNPFRGLSQDERAEYKDVPKEIEQSQDYMDAALVARAAEREEKENQKKNCLRKKETACRCRRVSRCLWDLPQ